MAKASGVRAAPKLSKPNRKGSVELDFHSLLRLVSRWTVAVLVTEIERNGVMVGDGYGRLQQANDGDESDPRSRKFALKLLYDRYAEEQDPGPENSWDSERWDVETHPLETFGWPRRSLPKFGEIDIEQVVLGIEAPVPEKWVSEDPANAPEVSCKNEEAVGGWIPAARTFAKDYLASADPVVRPSQAKVSRAVARTLKQNKIFGRGSREITPDTIIREAIGGRWWAENTRGFGNPESGNPGIKKPI
jgi:hypothetical protein